MIGIALRITVASWLLALPILAQTIAPAPMLPSNNTSLFKLYINTPSAISDVGPIEPLTVQAGLDRSDATNISGLLVLTGLQGTVAVDELTGSDIAFIRCEDGLVKASDQFRVAASRNPAAIILYARGAARCAYTAPTGNELPYSMVYSMVSMEQSNDFVDFLRENPAVIPGLISQRQDLTTTAPTPVETASQLPTSASRSPGVMGPSPTTAVAMIVLYSITGVITALFLIIIITGAIRAHRHPERYGPRAAGHGRPRQSRAKGIARAMLDTLPIVKFGERTETAKPGADVELGSGGGQSAQPGEGAVTQAQEGAKAGDTTRDQAESKDMAPTSAAVANSPHTGTDEIGSTSADQVVPEEGQLGCSICTEDFVMGEDVRVLPCDHKYHPACVDPWLLNVSGTCPLCRIDLRPAPTTEERSDVVDGSSRYVDPTITMAGPHGADVNRLRISRFLELHLGLSPQDGPHERIAALRRFRDDNRDGGRSNSRRGSRLSGIIRESFRRHSTRMEPVESESGNPAQQSNQAPTAAQSQTGR